MALSEVDNSRFNLAKLHELHANFFALFLAVFLVFGLVACSSSEPVITNQQSLDDVSDNTDLASNSGGDLASSSVFDGSLADISCDIVSEDEIISVVGIGNDDEPVESTVTVNFDNLHCGWSSGGSRNVRDRSSVNLSDAVATVMMMPITSPADLDDHMFMKQISLENDPNAALPEFGDGAFRTGFGALMRVSGSYIIEVMVIVDMTEGDLEAAKALSELIVSRLP
jgi:hypothetical protein